jgi:hypothetical protein
VIDSGLELLLPLSHASGSTEVRPHEIGIEREQFFLKKKKKRREKVRLRRRKKEVGETKLI